MKCRLIPMVVLALAALTNPAAADDVAADAITVSGPWSRATVGAMRSAVIYLTISNRGDTADRLVGVATAVAGMASLHRSAMDGGVMTMRPVSAIAVGPGATTVLEPGGLHIMLMNLEKPLLEGETFAADLIFEKAGTLHIEVTVVEPGALHGPKTRD